jgi:hypothetical protein
VVFDGAGVRPAGGEDAQVDRTDGLPHAALEEAQVVVASVLFDDGPLVAGHGAELAHGRQLREQGGDVVGGEAGDGVLAGGEQELELAHVEGLGGVAQPGGGVGLAVAGVALAECVCGGQDGRHRRVR